MLKFVSAILATAALTLAQPAKKPSSPPAETSITVDGKMLTIKYSAPSLNGRQMFGEGGRISKDPNYPVWRAGANSATAFHTDAELDIRGLKVPPGDYTLYVLTVPDPWQLIISKQTGQWGLTYKPENDLGRVKMDVTKPPSPIETYKMTLSSVGGKSAKLQLEWENVIAAVPIKVM